MDPRCQELQDKVLEIETEMRRISYWSEGGPAPADPAGLYANLPFEPWLQFVFLPSVRDAAASLDFSGIPPYRVGLAAQRQYDYHSTIEEATELVRLCWELERLLAARNPGSSQPPAARS